MTETKKTTLADEPKTIRVRIAVAVTPNGCWSSDGAKLGPENFYTRTDREMSGPASSYIFGAQGAGHIVFIEADVPLPEPQTLEGTVSQYAATALGKDGA